MSEPIADTHPIYFKLTIRNQTGLNLLVRGQNYRVANTHDIPDGHDEVVKVPYADAFLVLVIWDKKTKKWVGINPIEVTTDMVHHIYVPVAGTAAQTKSAAYDDDSVPTY